MRLLRNILLMILPIMIMINLYRFVFITDDYQFKGLAYLHENLSTFNGLNTTMNMINTIGTKITEFDSLEVHNLIDLFNAMGRLVEMIGMGISVPFMVVTDIVINIVWFIQVMFIN